MSYGTNELNIIFLIENHIGEDVETCIQALKQRDMETFDRSAGLVRGRTERVISVVMAEMENFERGPYTEGVEKTVRSLKEDSKWTTPPPRTILKFYLHPTI